MVKDETLHWPPIDPLYSVSGFLVGALVGLTGVGGGSLMTPILVLVFGVAPQAAVGTDLLYAALTKASGATVHGFKGTVDWRIVRRLAAGSVPATGLTLLCLKILGESQHSAGRLITIVLGAALILTAIMLHFRQSLLAHSMPRVERMSDNEMRLATSLFGAIVGALVSISSVGAGSICVTVLILLYPKLPTARIVGTDIAHAVPLTLIAGLGHWAMGAINWGMLISLLIGSLPGIAIGSHFAAAAPDRILRPLMAAVLAVIGIRLIL